MGTPAGTILSNPFVAGRPLTGASASLYVGRGEVFDWFQENLAGPWPSNAFLLYGERRIGKTSTLYQLVEGERGSRLRNSTGRSMIAAYIDLQRLAGRPTEEWLRRLAGDLARKSGTSHPSHSSPENGSLAETSFAVFDQALDRIESALPDNVFMLVALDEFEQVRDGIESGILDPSVLPFLRSQIQHRERIAFLICGSRSLLDPYWSPIIDLAARYEITPLSYDEAVSLIRRPIAGVLSVEDSAVELIWMQTDGRPFIIQTICHRLVSLANRRRSYEPITRHDAENVIRQLETEAYTILSATGKQNRPEYVAEGTPT